MESLPLIVQIIGVVLTLLGFVIAGFWRVWGLIKDVRTEAAARAEAAVALSTLSRDELSAHRLHVAETYVTKAGMTEQTDRIMRSLEGVADKIDRTNERLDSLMLQKPTPRTRTV